MGTLFNDRRLSIMLIWFADKPDRISQNAILAVRMFGLALAGLLLCTAFAEPARGQNSQDKKDRGQQNIQSDPFDELTQQLGHSSFKKRDEATRKLKSLGPAVVPAIVKAIGNAEGEKRFRLKQVLSFSARQPNLDQFPKAVAAIATLKNSDEAWLKNLAIDILGPDPDNELSADIAKWMKARLKSEKPIQFEEIYKRVKSSRAIVAKSSKANRKNDWRKLSDTSARQKVLMYRIKWFNGHWSQWFIPGFNDVNRNTPGKRQWNLFYDHTHEVITIEATRGNFLGRDDFLKAAKKD